MILGGGPSDDASEFREVATHRAQIVDFNAAAHSIRTRRR